jgi:hypothetical protein
MIDRPTQKVFVIRVSPKLHRQYMKYVKTIDTDASKHLRQFMREVCK